MMIMMIKMMKRMMMLYKSLGNFCIGRFLGTLYIYTLRDFLLPYITPHYVSSHGEEQQSTFPGQSTAFPVCSHLVKESGLGIAAVWEAHLKIAPGAVFHKDL